MFFVVPLQFRALSTLSALRAPVDKAVQTMELEVNEAIPKPYAGYFAKSFRGKERSEEGGSARKYE